MPHRYVHMSSLLRICSRTAESNRYVRVLGMVDQWWDFAFTAGDAIKSAGLDKQGCSYVPLPITISICTLGSHFICTAEYAFIVYLIIYGIIPAV